jgi:uncharacterized protein YggE
MTMMTKKVAAMAPLLLLLLFLSLLCGTANAQQQAAACCPTKKTMKLRAQAEVKSLPSLVHMNLVMQTRSADINKEAPLLVSEEQVKTANAQKTAQTLAVLRQWNISNAALESTAVSFTKEHQWVSGSRRFVGHHAKHELSVKTAAMQHIGSLIAALTSSGNAEVKRVQFESSEADKQAAENSAIGIATGYAWKKLSVMAAAAPGVSPSALLITKLEVVSPGPVFPPQPFQQMQALSMSSSAEVFPVATKHVITVLIEAQF